MTIVRYVLVQLVAYGIDLGGFYALISTTVIGPLPANVGGKIAAGLFAFFAHRRFTFNVQEETGKVTQAVRYFILLAVNVPMSSLILAGMLLIITDPVPAKICSGVASVGLSFLLTKYLVFGRRRRGDTRAAGCASGSSGIE